MITPAQRGAQITADGFDCGDDFLAVEGDDFAGCGGACEAQKQDHSSVTDEKVAQAAQAAVQQQLGVSDETEGLSSWTHIRAREQVKLKAREQAELKAKEDEECASWEPVSAVHDEKPLDDAISVPKPKPPFSLDQIIERLGKISLSARPLQESDVFTDEDVPSPHNPIHDEADAIAR